MGCLPRLLSGDTFSPCFFRGGSFGWRFNYTRTSYLSFATSNLQQLLLLFPGEDWKGARRFLFQNKNFLHVWGVVGLIDTVVEPPMAHFVILVQVMGLSESRSWKKMHPASCYCHWDTREKEVVEVVVMLRYIYDDLWLLFHLPRPPVSGKEFASWWWWGGGRRCSYYPSLSSSPHFLFSPGLRTNPLFYSNFSWFLPSPTSSPSLLILLFHCYYYHHYYYSFCCRSVINSTTRKAGRERVDEKPTSSSASFPRPPPTGLANVAIAATFSDNLEEEAGADARGHWSHWQRLSICGLCMKWSHWRRKWRPDGH